MNYRRHLGFIYRGYGERGVTGDMEGLRRGHELPFISGDTIFPGQGRVLRLVNDKSEKYMAKL